MRTLPHPKGLQAPRWRFSKEGRFDRNGTEAEEARYLAELQTDLRAGGYAGELTGRLVRFPHADGFAIYMVAQKGSAMALMHCQLGDAWEIPVAHLRGLSREDILACLSRDR